LRQPLSGIFYLEGVLRGSAHVKTNAMRITPFNGYICGFWDKINIMTFRLFIYFISL